MEWQIRTHIRASGWHVCEQHSGDPAWYLVRKRAEGKPILRRLTNTDGSGHCAGFPIDSHLVVPPEEQ